MKKQPPILKILKAVRRLLSKKERWTKNHTARTKNGELTNYADRTAYAFCLTGAICRIGSTFYERKETSILLKNHLPRPFKRRNDNPGNLSLMYYNDHPRTQHKDILNLLDSTISSFTKGAQE